MQKVARKKVEISPERIKRARYKLDLSQSAAAAKWGFAVQTLNAWECGTRNPAGLYREKLEEILERIEALK
jgi:DNA-binding transcriptional regulator YiaG